MHHYSTFPPAFRSCLGCERHEVHELRDRNDGLLILLCADRLPQRLRELRHGVECALSVDPIDRGDPLRGGIA
eukprot:6482221-Pyramimonas_sp.AAC.1